MAATEPASASPLGRRAAARQRTLARIVELGNAQLLERGPADLSVREIARGLGLVSSAIYRYVSSRDELLTLLIVDAYDDLADAVDRAIDAVPAGPRERFDALAHAMATWASTHPERWILLYGTPVRGYRAPAESTTAPGTRVARTVLSIAAESPTPVTHPVPPLSPDLADLLDRTLDEFEIDTDPGTALRAITAWSSLIGVISAHLFGHLGADAVALGDQVLDVQFQLLAELITAPEAR